MPPTLALIIWLVLLLALLRFDPARDHRASPALWVSVVWIFFVASRNPSLWIGEQAPSMAAAFEQGSLLNSVIFSVLILMAIGILVLRSFNWGGLFSRNFFLTAFIGFALLSVLWSDFPFITFKRWLRDCGGYLMILIVLSDRRPLHALRTLLRRLCYLLIPLSILLVKYFPGIGKSYDEWNGVALYSGAATGKNNLAVVCLVSGVFFFWDTLTRWSDRGKARTQKSIVVNLAFLAMTLWLLRLADSVTSDVCLVIACLILALAHSRFGRRNPGFLKLACPAAFLMYLLLAFGFGMLGRMAQAVGRSATLTDRVPLWATVLGTHTNPLFGTGYQSFWLGTRLQSVWRAFPGINEAHNGYLQIYLDLGLIGLFLLCGFLIASYRAICSRLKPFSEFGSLSLALWTVLLFYNVTEASLEASVLWIAFLLVAVAAPERVARQVSALAATGNSLPAGCGSLIRSEIPRRAELS